MARHRVPVLNCDNGGLGAHAVHVLEQLNCQQKGKHPLASSRLQRGRIRTAMKFRTPTDLLAAERSSGPARHRLRSHAAAASRGDGAAFAPPDDELASLLQQQHGQRKRQHDEPGAVTRSGAVPKRALPAPCSRSGESAELGRRCPP